MLDLIMDLPKIQGSSIKCGALRLVLLVREAPDAP